MLDRTCFSVTGLSSGNRRCKSIRETAPCLLAYMPPDVTCACGGGGVHAHVLHAVVVGSLTTRPWEGGGRAGGAGESVAQQQKNRGK